VKRVWAALALAAALAGCGGARHPAPPPRDGVPPPPRPRHAATFAALAAREAARQRALERAIARARRSPTVPGALRLARLTRRLTGPQERSAWRAWAAAQAMAARLTGVRQAELSSVIAGVGALAAVHGLTPSRIPASVLTLRVNTRFWARAPLPAPHFRTGGTAIFQYYPGSGLQFQPLASWGRVNALAAGCERNRCRRRRLTRALDRLTRLAARRDGFLAWEYYFPYAQGTPPWVSAMTQATALQALARGYNVLGAKRFKRTALAALGAFERPAPAGVTSGTHYVLYSFAPGYHVLNGELQAVIGLSDLAALTGSKRAARLFRAGERTVRAEVAGFDTGAWSLYSVGGAEATLSYHDLMVQFLDGLCERVHAAVYCRTGARFARYEHEPPRIGVAPLRHPPLHRPSEVRFTLSKISTVRVRVWSARGVSLTQSLQLPRGGHAVAWEPSHRGRYHLEISARGPSGPVGVARETIHVGRGAAATRRGNVATTPRRPPAAMGVTTP
jgi:hypothetical protein